jgi:tight adherence protein B
MSLAAGMIPGYAAYLFTRSSTIAMFLGIPLSMIPLAVVFIKRGRRFNKFEEELPKGLDLMVSALKAGHSFNAALGLAAREAPEPICSEFRICFDEQNYGLDLRQAVENLMIRVPVTDLRIAATAVLIQKETGGNLAEVLENTSEVIRERARLKRQMRVHTAHGRMTGWVIGLLPIALFIVLYIINPGMESLLWKREMGVKLLYTGGGMMVVGALLIRKIVRADV